MATEVIAIGASLGGLDALHAVLGRIPAGFPAAIVIAQHRGADGSDVLLRLLRSYSWLSVREPDDKDRIVPGQAYLAPAGYHLLVEPGFFALSIDGPVCFARPSIDVLFESVADSYAERGGCVVLTGSSEDGARGARAIKENGGFVLVQDPDEALSPIAPIAVLAGTRVDAVVPLDRAAIWMCRWCHTLPAPQKGQRERFAPQRP